MSQSPIHTNLQAIVADSSNPEKFWLKKFIQGLQVLLFFLAKRCCSLYQPREKVYFLQITYGISVDNYKRVGVQY
jgi:hypothetical protein